MPATYEPIATYTVPSSQASYTFTSIPSTYTDLVLVASGTISNAENMRIQFNGDTTNKYSNTVVYGNGTSALGTRNTNTTELILASFNGTDISNAITHIMNYSNTTTYKTVLQRGNNSTFLVRADVGMWQSTAAINSIKLFPTGTNTLNTGFTLTLYGIKAA